MAIDVQDLNHKRKWPKRLAVMVVVVMVLTLLLGYYLLLWPVDVLEVRSTKMLTGDVEPGGVVIYEFCYDKFMDVTATVTKVLTGVGEDGVARNYALPMTAGIFSPGEDECVIDSTQIPVYVVPGKYRICYRADYYINPVRRHPERFQTDKFRVVKR